MKTSKTWSRNSNKKSVDYPRKEIEQILSSGEVSIYVGALIKRLRKPELNKLEIAEVACVLHAYFYRDFDVIEALLPTGEERTIALHDLETVSMPVTDSLRRERMRSR